MASAENLNNISKSTLDINTETYYFEKLRPYMQEMMRTCKTDPELYKTLDKVINAVDPLCMNKKYKDIEAELDVLITAITDTSYFTNGPMRRGTEEEKQFVRDLSSKLSDFIMIIKCEPEVSEKEKKTKDRLNYRNPTATSPDGENEDYITHNMKNLNVPNPKPRIPNV